MQRTTQALPLGNCVHAEANQSRYLLACWKRAMFVERFDCSTRTTTMDRCVNDKHLHHHHHRRRSSSPSLSSSIDRCGAVWVLHPALKQEDNSLLIVMSSMALIDVSSRSALHSVDATSKGAWQSVCCADADADADTHETMDVTMATIAVLIKTM